MKKISKFLVLLAIVSLSALTKTKAQEIGVTLRLNRPHQYDVNERVHPRRPSARHVWVAEEWVGHGKTYDYHPGYWALPPHPRANWVPGHWIKREHNVGYYWARGHWN